MTTITNGYCTLQQLAETIGVGIALQTDQDNYMRAINTASRWVDQWCGRRFYVDQAASARKFTPCAVDWLDVDDFSTTTGLVIKTNPTADGATYQTTITAGDYLLRPVNSTGPNGVSGWPFTSIQLMATSWLAGNFQPSAEITAKWGWAAIPDDVQQATIHAAEYIYKTKDAPFGSAGIGDLGITRAYFPTVVKDLLASYRKYGATGTPMVG